MPITGRPAIRNDIEACLAIEARGRADSLSPTHLENWRRLADHPSFLSAVIEANPAIEGYQLIGFGAAAIVNSRFGEAEAARPRPDIVSRIFESFHSGSSALATRNEIASGNADGGLDFVIVYNFWRESILSPEERYEFGTIFVSGFVRDLTGYRVRRILNETSNPAAIDFTRRSAEFQVLAEFPEVGRVIFQMTKQSAMALPGSVANVIFSYNPPQLRLRDSDQQLLLAALRAATDAEIAVALRLKPSAVKARWRSTFARIAEVMPDLVNEWEIRDGRGSQKRHRVLAYVRSHMEELRPFDWKSRAKVRTASAI